MLALLFHTPLRSHFMHYACQPKKITLIDLVLSRQILSGVFGGYLGDVTSSDEALIFLMI